MQIPRTEVKLWQSVEQQAEKVPQIYAGIDFATMPERFTIEAASDGAAGGPLAFPELMPEVMADAALIETMAAYTLMGDPVADAFAARSPEFGFRQLVEMLGVACDGGLDAASDAPPELASYGADTPTGLRWQLGSRLLCNQPHMRSIIIPC